MFTVNFGTKSRTPLEQLLNTAKANKLYDDEVLNSISTNDQKIKYLEMLSTANTLALSNRVSPEYNDISDKILKFQVLETEYEIAVQEKLQTDANYQKFIESTQKDKLNKQFSEDSRITGNNAIKTVVDTKYGGDYSQFMSEYESDEKFFSDEYLAYTGQYDEAETADTLKYMRETEAALKSENDVLAKLYDRRDQLATMVAADRKYRIEKTAFDNASWVEKAGQSLTQMLAAPVTELGNVFEGVIDAVLLGASQICDWSGNNSEAETLKTWIANDIIPLDTLLAEALPYSYITSPYAEDNAFRWLYEIETSIIDMSPMALNLVVPGLGTVLYYVSAAGRTGEGYTLENADAGIGEITTYTIATTAIEILTEKLNTDAVFGKGMLDDWIKIGNGNAGINFIKEMLGEGVEEIISETGSQFVGTILTGENKFDGQQIIRAGVLGAATSMVIQTGSNTMLRRRLLGINTRLTNVESGMTLDLSGRESMIVEDFLEKCKAKLDAGKSLSKKNQELYDTFNKFDRYDYIDGNKLKRRFYRIARAYANESYIDRTAWTYGSDRSYVTNEYTADQFEDFAMLEPDQLIESQDSNYYSRRYAGDVKFTGGFEEVASKTIFSMEQRETRNIISQRTDLIETGKLIQPAFYIPGYYAAYTEYNTKFDELIDAVDSGEDINAILDDIVTEDTATQMRTELSQMASVWTNANLAADENNQAVLEAVNGYYNGTLENIVERLQYKPSANQTNATLLSSALGIDAVLTLDEERSIRSSLQSAISTAYPNAKLYTYVTDSRKAPVVTIINGNIYVNHKYLRASNLSSVIRAIEMQMITHNAYFDLDEKQRSHISDLRKQLYGLMYFDGTLRSIQLDKQILYTALFVPGNDLALQLSELNHTGYEKLLKQLKQRADVQNISVKNAAYRAMHVYDLTILKRLDNDEAMKRNVLSGNYSIEDLRNELGPIPNRATFRYGIDASNAAVRVYSAVRHLQENFGFETDISNIYQVLLDIKNPDKYKKLSDLTSLLNRYAITLSRSDKTDDKIAFDQSINLYLRDQFDFEIDPLGTIVASKDIDTILDNNKVIAALKSGKPISLESLLTPFAKTQISNVDCVLTFTKSDDWKYNKTTRGRTSAGVGGRGLIEIQLDSRNIKDQYMTVCHEIQHFFTHGAHLPRGTKSIISDNHITSVFNKLSDSEKSKFIASALEFIIDNHADAVTSVMFASYEVSDFDNKLRPDLLNAISSTIYTSVDTDEELSKFKLNRRLAQSTGAYFSTSGHGVMTFDIPKNSTLSVSQKNFLQYFVGNSFHVRSSDIDTMLTSILNGKETFDQIIEAGLNPEIQIEEASEQRSELDLYEKLNKVINLKGIKPSAKLLCKPHFWVENAISPELKARLQKMTTGDCKKLVTRLTGLVFDDFVGDFVLPENAFKPAEYIKYIDGDALVQDKSGSVVIQLPRDYTPRKYASITRALADLTEDQRNSAAYYVDDRVFANARSALEYVDTSYVNAGQNLNKPNNPLLAMFDHLIDSIVPNGFTHSSDFMFITHDGKVSSYNTDGKPGEKFRQFADALNINFEPLSRGLTVDMNTGDYTGVLETGVFKQLFDAKKIVRAYYMDGKWIAYGKPNVVQDNALRQLNTISPQHTYLLPENSKYNSYIPGTAKLVISKDNKVLIDRHNTTGLPEVYWKNNAWYGSICQIIEKYNLTKISDFKQLGFNSDFVSRLEYNFGRNIQRKTQAKLNLGEELLEKTERYSGLAQDAINAFINDDAAHPFARNLLIQNAPQRAATDNLNWQLCSHLRSVQDIDAYYRAILAYSGTLLRKGNTKKYSSLEDLIVDCKKEYIKGDEEKSLLSSVLKINADVDLSNIVSLFLNIDARQESKSIRKVADVIDGETKEGAKRLYTMEGLDYSLAGFEAAVGNIARGYARSTKSAQAISDELTGSGRHADDETTVNISDTSAAAIAKSMLDSAETKLDTEENLVYLNWYKKNVAGVTKQFAKDPDAAKNNITKMQKVLTKENAKIVEGEAEGSWDPYLKYLHDSLSTLQRAFERGADQKTAVKQKGLDELIETSKKRIEESEDKLSAQDTEYQLLTSKAPLLRQQYGDEGYQRALEAIRGTVNKGEAKSNINDNISKRLRASGSASINARIDKLIENPQLNTQLKNLSDNLASLNKYFAGVKPGTAEYSTMRFRYSNLLTQFYNFVKMAAKGNFAEFSSIKAERKAIAEYFDNLILDGDFDFAKVYSADIAILPELAEQFVSGNIDFEGYTEYANEPLSVRIEFLQTLMRTVDPNTGKLYLPIPIIDRMQRIIDNAAVEESASEARDKPTIDLKFLKLAREQAGLSNEVMTALDNTIDSINQMNTSGRSDKRQKALLKETTQAGRNAVFNAKYLSWSHDRLNKEYKKYLNSPAITQTDAERLVAHAAEMVKNFDYQTTTNSFRVRANLAWKNEKRADVVKSKAVLSWIENKEWPKNYKGDKSKIPNSVDIELALKHKKEYTSALVETYERVAAAHADESRMILQWLKSNKTIEQVKSDVATKYKPADAERLIERYSKALESKQRAAHIPKPVVTDSTAIKTTPTFINSVSDILNMYNIDNIPDTVKPDEYTKYYTTHRSLQEVLEDADTNAKKFGESENQLLNGIINGVSLALTEFEYRPMTIASGLKFILDVRSVLQDKTLNKSLFNWKSNVSIQKDKRTFAPIEGENSQKTLLRLIKQLETGEFTSRAETLENELNQSIDELSGAINTLVQEVKNTEITATDEKLDSSLSQKMRWEDSDWDAAFADLGIENIGEDEEFNIEEIGEEANELIADDEFDLDEFVVDTISQPVENDNEPKSDKKNQRSADEQFKEEPDASRSSYKTVKSDLLTRNGVDIEKALNYQFEKTAYIDVYGQKLDRQQVSTKEFITNPTVSKILRQLLSSEAAMNDFVDWLSEARAIDSQTQLKALIILNQIEANPMISFEIRRKAQKIRKTEKSIAGAILGLGSKHGLSPAQEVASLAMDLLTLTDAEKAELDAITKRQDKAIAENNYKVADETMKEALKIFEKHKSELPMELNPFGKTDSSDKLQAAKLKLQKATTDSARMTAQTEVDALQRAVDNERAIRWKNLTNKITTWRYFAMLSSPATFFSKNVAGNYVAQGLNRVSTELANKIQVLVDKKRGFKYTRTSNRTSEAAKLAVKKQLIDNGLVDSIMSNTAAKYDTGYTYRPSELRNLTIDSLDDTLDPNKYATLNQLINQKTPFGTSNPAAKALNKFYGIIFDTMDKFDKKFMRADIIRLTEQLVSDNFKSNELKMLQDGTADDAVLNKFHEIVEYSRQEACKTYFRSSPKIYQTMMQLLSKYPMAQAIVSTIMPFPRMVVNATMTALAYSPFGFIEAVMTLKTDQSMFANITASQQFARAATGTTVMVIGAILAALGVIGIDDEDPYSGPQLTIGDLRVSLEGLEPSATPFIVGAMFVLGPQSEETSPFTAAANALLDTTILGELMNQFGTTTGTQWIGNLFASYVTQFVPSVLRRVTQLIDPGKKNYTGEFRTLKRIVAAIPLLSFTVEDKIDPYTGDTLVQYTDNNNTMLSRFLVLFNAVSPTKISWSEDSVVETESRAVNATTTGPAKTITKNGVDYEIPKKLYNQYKVLRAQLYSQYANELIKTAEYQKLSNEKKALKLKALQKRATQEARRQLNIDKELNIP